MCREKSRREEVFGVAPQERLEKGKESVMEGVEPNDEMECDLDGEEATAVADI